PRAPPGVVERLESAVRLAVSPRNADQAADPCGAGEPGGPGRAKTLPAIPFREALWHRTAQGAKKVVRFHRQSRSGKIGRGIGRIGRMKGAIDADTDDRNQDSVRSGLSLDQN